MIHEYFPEVAIEIQKEISARHPLLESNLKALPAEASLEERFAMIFAYCGMLVDGWYDDEKTGKLLHTALDRLKAASTIYIN